MENEDKEDEAEEHDSKKEEGGAPPRNQALNGVVAMAPVVLDDDVVPATTNLDVIPDHNGENAEMGLPKVLLPVEAEA